PPRTGRGKRSASTQASSIAMSATWRATPISAGSFFERLGALPRRIWPIGPIALTIAQADSLEEFRDGSARSDFRRRRPAGTGQCNLREDRGVRRDLARKPFG